MRKAVEDSRVRFPTFAYIGTEVDLILSEDRNYLWARLNITLPGIQREIAPDIAHRPIKRAPFKGYRGKYSCGE